MTTTMLATAGTVARSDDTGGFLKGRGRFAKPLHPGVLNHSAQDDRWRNDDVGVQAFHP